MKIKNQETDGRPPLGLMRSPEYMHPLYTDVVKELMLNKGYDIEAYSKKDVLSLWRAIKRLGYWCCYLQIGTAKWVVRASKVELNRKTNPLFREYRRSYETDYGKWQDLVTDLSEGKLLTFSKRADAVRVKRLAKERFPREAGYLAFNTTIKPVGEKFELSLEWVESGKRATVA